MPQPYEVALQGMMAGMLAVHLGRSGVRDGAVPSIAAGSSDQPFYRCLQAATFRAVIIHDEASSTSQTASAQANEHTRRIRIAGCVPGHLCEIDGRSDPALCVSLYTLLRALKGHAPLRMGSLGRSVGRVPTCRTHAMGNYAYFFGF